MANEIAIEDKLTLRNMEREFLLELLRRDKMAEQKGAQMNQFAGVLLEKAGLPNDSWTVDMASMTFIPVPEKSEKEES